MDSQYFVNALFATTPTATSADPYLPIGGVAVVGVVPGSALKVALLAV